MPRATAARHSALVALAAAEALPYARRLGSGSGQIRYLEASTVWGVAVLLAGVGGDAAPRALARGPESPRRSSIVEALLLFLVPEASAPRSVTVDTAPVAYLQRHLGSSRFFTLGPLQPNYGSYFGIASLNVNDVPVPPAFADYVTRRLDQAVDPTVFVGNLGGGRPPSAPSPEAELLRNLAGYRAAASRLRARPGRGRRSPGGFTLVFRSPTTWIYRLAGADPARHGTRLHRRGDRGFGSALLPTSNAARRRETALPGWHATLDGHRVPAADRRRPLPGASGRPRLAPRHVLLLAALPRLGNRSLHPRMRRALSSTDPATPANAPPGTGHEARCQPSSPSDHGTAAARLKISSSCSLPDRRRSCRCRGRPTPPARASSRTSASSPARRSGSSPCGRLDEHRQAGRAQRLRHVEPALERFAEDIDPNPWNLQSREHGVRSLTWAAARR